MLLTVQNGREPYSANAVHTPEYDRYMKSSTITFGSTNRWYTCLYTWNVSIYAAVEEMSRRKLEGAIRLRYKRRCPLASFPSSARTASRIARCLRGATHFPPCDVEDSSLWMVREMLQKPAIRCMFGVGIVVHDTVTLTKPMEIHAQTISNRCKTSVYEGCVVGE